ADVLSKSDCTVLNDCGSGYFPQLSVDTTPIAVTAAQGGSTQVRYIPVRNDAGGTMLWNAHVDYGSGSSSSGANWITLDRTSGANNATIRADILPSRITAAGSYRATIVVDAGTSGSSSIPVTLTVTPSTPAVQGPVVTSVSHAAIGTERSLVPGGIAMLKGSKLDGKSVEVKVDGAGARILYSSTDQINFLVPET